MNREEVAKALDELGVTATLANDPVDGSRIEVVHLDDLARIGAVFEQAHTPTDDERSPEFEALEQELFKHQPVLSMSDGRIAGCQCMDRVFYQRTEDWGTHLAEVFTALRRPVQGEPEWEYTWAGHDGEDDWVLDETFATQGEAVKFIRTQGWVLRQGGSLHRRRAAGPWLPVTNTESED